MLLGISLPAREAETAPGFRLGKISCRLCCLREFCAPGKLSSDEIELLKTFVKKQELRLERGAQIYRQGDPFRGLFAVHTGSFKLAVASPEGIGRVTGFAFAGDLMGLDGIDAGRHVQYAVALEQSGACLLPWDRLEEAAGRIALVRRQLMRMLSREIRRGDELSLLLAELPPVARVAAFLLGVSESMAYRGFDGTRLRLSMSRVDIASFLGLSAETVSRLFTRFRDLGFIRARAKQLELVQVHALRALARQKNPIRPQN